MDDVNRSNSPRFSKRLRAREKLARAAGMSVELHCQLKKSAIKSAAQTHPSFSSPPTGKQAPRRVRMIRPSALSKMNCCNFDNFIDFFLVRLRTEICWGVLPP